MNSSSTSIKSQQSNGQILYLRLLVFSLFFIFGGITSLNDILLPKLKGLFELNYTQAMLTQSVFFAAYFLVSMPAGYLVRRLGYMASAVIGLLTMTLGCLLFIPASLSATFAIFLFALFVVAIGITTVQVVANPLISILGDPSTAHSRLTFAQAFNALGTTVAPYIGARIILGSLSSTDQKSLAGDALAAFRATETHTIVQTYLGIASILACVSLAVWINRGKLRSVSTKKVRLLSAVDLLRRPRFVFGTIGIFAYVGAEVSIGSLLVNYLMQPSVFAIDARTAGEFVAFYWGGAMIGRFVGAALLRIFSPGKVLSVAAIIVLVLLGISANSVGLLSGWSILLVGLFNSIMFPTIFSLACDGLGERAPEGSGLICMAIVGGGILPLLTGFVADRIGLSAALAVPAISYATIASFGWYTRRRDTSEQPEFAIGHGHP
ncbi:sugar MFS transporter [Beijerinckia mobilis]|uniref:sugar MFS transporter n=1 Tax=Beijerinckia mobilis TaxID=231434 RepID=UPI00068D92F9|nr:sugar MFS transporter [Beijerinckia mobilis]